jgi:hypothetical protein
MAADAAEFSGTLNILAGAVEYFCHNHILLNFTVFGLIHYGYIGTFLITACVSLNGE